MKRDISIIGAIPLAVFLALWELLPRAGAIDPVFLPPLSTVVETVVGLWHGGDLQTHALVSLRRALVGFLAAVALGLPLGLVVGGWFPRLQTALEPLMELFAQANPVVLFHIIILFLGIGEGAKTFIIGWLCLWPVTFSAINGVRGADPLILKAARSLGVGRLRLFVSVVIPLAAPSIFAGLRLSAGYAFIMLIAAEMMGASSGLGWLVIQAQESYHVARIFAGAAVITVMALAVDGILKLIGLWLAPARDTEESRPLGELAANVKER
ncbi:ABC transporter permease [Geobacter hydrogenophilus]|uniref:ABC transporter permease n=1 Tax=Geobacter hydrogenophilus TaxID=40983 RepID=A0A9W6LD65_9BACT|nr:ABC transporter permease [Geobacter hydrogenophilus]MBT0894396.1 ABC transporter permease [Geobacter hydrogenophilus]GLI39448.1 ABC transporter permease [Geobacter hydrogenophilus]